MFFNKIVVVFGRVPYNTRKLIKKRLNDFFYNGYDVAENNELIGGLNNRFCGLSKILFSVYI